MLTFLPWILVVGASLLTKLRKCMSNVPSLFFRFRTAKFRIGTWCLQTFRIFKIAKETGGDKKRHVHEKTQRTEDFIRTEHGIRFVNHSMLGALIEVLGPFGFPGSSGVGQVYRVPLFYMGSFVFFFPPSLARGI